MGGGETPGGMPREEQGRPWGINKIENLRCGMRMVADSEIMVQLEGVGRLLKRATASSLEHGSESDLSESDSTGTSKLEHGWRARA